MTGRGLDDGQSGPAVVFVDIPVHASVLPRNASAVFSTSPVATIALREQGLAPRLLEDLCTPDDLGRIHRRVVDLVDGLRSAFARTELAVRHPDPFLVHAYDLNLMFFSLLSKLHELQTVLAEQPEAHLRASGLLVVTDAPRSPSVCYPLRESAPVYPWLLGELARARGVPIQEIRPRGTAVLPAAALGMRQRLWRAARRIGSSPLRARRAARGAAGGAGTVLGWAAYDAGILAATLFPAWGVRLHEPHDLVDPDQGEIRGVSDGLRRSDLTEAQRSFAAWIDQELRAVFSRIFPGDKAAVLRSLVPVIAAGFKNYIGQSIRAEEYLKALQPRAFISAGLSASWADRLMALTCRRHQVPVIGLQHGGSYGELAVGSSAVGVPIYLDELECTDVFFAYGPGTAVALERAQRTFRPDAPQATVVAASALSIPPPDPPVQTPPGPPITAVLYVAHYVQVNAVRLAWFRDRYVEHVLEMADILAEALPGRRVVVKLHPRVDRYQVALRRAIRRRAPALRFAPSAASLETLAQDAQLVIIDFPSTSLYQVLPWRVNIATVEQLAHAYRGLDIMDRDALALLRQRCFVAADHAELRTIVRRCLSRPAEIRWPDVNDDAYLYRYVRTPPDQDGVEVIERVLAPLLARAPLVAGAPGVPLA